MDEDEKSMCEAVNSALVIVGMTERDFHTALMGCQQDPLNAGKIHTI